MLHTGVHCDECIDKDLTYPGAFCACVRSVWLAVYLAVRLSVSLSISLSVSVCLAGYVSVCVCACVCPCACLPVVFRSVSCLRSCPDFFATNPDFIATNSHSPCCSLLFLLLFSSAGCSCTDGDASTCSFNGTCFGGKCYCDNSRWGPACELAPVAGEGTDRLLGFAVLLLSFPLLAALCFPVLSVLPLSPSLSLSR